MFVGESWHLRCRNTPSFSYLFHLKIYCFQITMKTNPKIRVKSVRKINLENLKFKLMSSWISCISFNLNKCSKRRKTKTQLPPMKMDQIKLTILISILKIQIKMLKNKAQYLNYKIKNCLNQSSPSNSKDSDLNISLNSTQLFKWIDLKYGSSLIFTIVYIPHKSILWFLIHVSN